MSKAVSVKSSDVQWAQGQHGVFASSGYQAFAVGAVSNAGAFIAPCDMKIVGAEVNVISTTSNAGAKINIGKQGDSDYFLDGYVIQNLSAGLYDLIGDALFLVKDIAKGDVVSFELEAASAAGAVCITLFAVPKVQVA